MRARVVFLPDFKAASFQRQGLFLKVAVGFTMSVQTGEAQLLKDRLLPAEVALDTLEEVVTPLTAQLVIFILNCPGKAVNCVDNQAVICINLGMPGQKQFREINPDHPATFQSPKPRHAPQWSLKHCRRNVASYGTP